jgi:N-acylneuraminate cytidylyltransferase
LSTIALIPARGGSQRIPRKNTKHFHGKPIIAYSIEKARESGLFDRIIVTTDDVNIGVLAEYYGAESYMRSEEFYGRDSTGTQEVVKECLEGIQAGKLDVVCCIYATAPLMSVMDLCEGYLVLDGWRGDSVTYVMSAGYPPLQDAGQFYWGMAFSFMDNIPLVSKHTRLICVDENRVCDINTEADWVRAVKMYEDLK